MLLTARGVCPLVKELKLRQHSSVPLMASRMSIRSDRLAGYIGWVSSPSLSADVASVVSVALLGNLLTIFSMGTFLIGLHFLH